MASKRYKKGDKTEKRGKENVRSSGKKGKENVYTPRPVMKKTSKSEIDAFLMGYKVNEEVPICGDHVSHATRFWTIVALYIKYPKRFTKAELCRHFGICERVLEGKYKNKIHEKMESYDCLSPSEYIENSRKATIEKYGRSEDIKKYHAEKNKK